MKSISWRDTKVFRKQWLIKGAPDVDAASRVNGVGAL
jgi:hypothetical protein